MIVYYLLQLFIGIGEMLTSVFGSVTLLPFGTDAPISQFWAWFVYIMQDLWPLQAVFASMLIYLGWRVSVKVYHTIFGSRAVVN